MFSCECRHIPPHYEVSFEIECPDPAPEWGESSKSMRAGQPLDQGPMIIVQTARYTLPKFTDIGR